MYICRTVKLKSQFKTSYNIKQSLLCILHFWSEKGPFEVETCGQIKDITFTSCADDDVSFCHCCLLSFLLLLSFSLFYVLLTSLCCRSQWPRGLRRRSAAARLLRLCVRIPPGAWMFVCCECCVLSGRGLCDELITRPEESYRLCSAVVFDLETS